NDFNRFGRTYKVTAQADAPHRMQAEAIGRLQVRNAAGAMLPLSSFVTVTPSSGPDRVIHYNGYPSADISGGALPGVSSGQAVALMERLAGEVLPEGMTFEWTDLTYQQKLAGNSALFIFPLCVLLAYLI
ncbi:efflux RND transporter permease subunit, partial [Pseudomonas aeruginosa]